MKALFALCLPLLLGGNVVHEDTTLFRNERTPFAKRTFVPELGPGLTELELSLVGESYHETVLLSTSWARFGVGAATHSQRAYFAPDIFGASLSDPLLHESHTSAPIMTGLVPPNTPVIVIVTETFTPSVSVVEPSILEDLEDGAAIEWAANSVVGGPAAGLSGPGTWSYRTFARHTLRGTTRVRR